MNTGARAQPQRRGVWRVAWPCGRALRSWSLIDWVMLHFQHLGHKTNNPILLNLLLQGWNKMGNRDRSENYVVVPRPASPYTVHRRPYWGSKLNLSLNPHMLALALGAPTLRWRGPGFVRPSVWLSVGTRCLHKARCAFCDPEGKAGAAQYGCNLKGHSEQQRERRRSVFMNKRWLSEMINQLNVPGMASGYNLVLFI